MTMINLGADFASAVKAEAVVGYDRRELVCEELVDATDEFGTQTVAVVRSEPAADKRKGSISALFYRL